MASASPHKTVDPGSHSSEEQDPMEHDGDATHDFEVKEQDRWLPIANVARIMKTALPDNAKIAKEAKECMQECVSEFISFITSEASEKCQQEKRKTVNGEDILFAMTSLGFENYAEALKIYLSKYRETQSARGENQGHPLSPPGYTSDPTNPGASVPLGSPSAAGFVQGGDGQSVLGGAGGLDPSDHSGSAAAAAASYGYPGMVGGSHNGAGGNGY